MPFSDAALEQAIRDLSERVPLTVSEHEIVLHGACRTAQDCRGGDRLGLGWPHSAGAPQVATQPSAKTATTSSTGPESSHERADRRPR